MSNFVVDAELAAEREYIGSLYERVDSEQASVARELDASLRDTGTAQWERQVEVNRLSTRLRALRAAGDGLCFGRIDDTDDNRTYVGRIGLLDEAKDYEPLLIDWRAPAARPFYCATVARPEGLVRRRHFRTNGRDVTAFHDDVLDSTAGAEQAGDAALLAALNAPREGTMRDIVATIQSEQDEIIRLEHEGVVVLEGGPGTGKTAVALHRVAYLLYTHRERLARRGVLVLGPNQGFLTYIGDVLPALGETSVVFATMGELFPGVRTTVADAPRATRVKGGLGMVDVLAAAVTDRQELPDEPFPLELHDVEIEVDDGVVAPARDRARATGLPHNDARGVFRQWLVEGLVHRAVERIGEGWLSAEDTAVWGELAADVRAELATNPDLDAAVERLWPWLTPERLLSELFSSASRIDVAGATLDEEDRAALYREVGDAWTVADVPLLDEAVELLGVDRSEEKRAEERRREHRKYVEGVLQVLDTDADLDEEVLRAVDLVDADTLSERHVERDRRDVAERAIADREWTYGHVVVDEAQEMSEMDWRLVIRRCPAKSMTVVGDLAQRRSTAGARTWGAMFDRYAAQWHYRALTINYRTPAEIMSVAADVLAEVNPALEPPESVRGNGFTPWARQVAVAELSTVVAEVVRNSPEQGEIAVIAPEGMSLDVDATVLSPRESKGLEFDVIVLVEPHEILAGAPHGAADLYVSLTRATQELVVLHTEPLPPALARLGESGEDGIRGEHHSPSRGVRGGGPGTRVRRRRATGRDESR